MIVSEEKNIFAWITTSCQWTLLLIWQHTCVVFLLASVTLAITNVVYGLWVMLCLLQINVETALWVIVTWKWQNLWIRWFRWRCVCTVIVFMNQHQSSPRYVRLGSTNVLLCIAGKILPVCCCTLWWLGKHYVVDLVVVCAVTGQWHMHTMLSPLMVYCYVIETLLSV